MDDVKNRWEIENAAWEAALSILDRNGEVIEEFESALERFIKRRACKEAPHAYCEEKLKAALSVAQCSVKFMRSKTGSLPPKPVHRYEILLTLAKELEIKCPKADASLHMTGCRYVELHWDR